MSQKRSLAYLRRSAANGRPYAQYKLSRLLLESIFTQLQGRQEAEKNLLAAHKAGYRLASRELATQDLISPDFTTETAAHVLLECCRQKLDTEAAVCLWHMYSYHLDKATLRDSFLPYARYSATIYEALDSELKSA